MSLSRSSCVALALLVASVSIAGAQATSALAGSSSFALHDGDNVTFYGDSITEQREYTEYVEEYVLTRFPQWKVTFHNAGVGGDKVSGGGAGPIDLRLQRDLLSAHPNVVTIMLGMNDGYYRPSQPGIVSSYVDGYRHIVDTIQKSLPECRITIIQPSPFDDITRVPEFPGGYNAALLVFSDAIGQIAKERNYGLTDFNTPVTAMLKTLNQESPNLAQQLLPDRVHPAEAGHWIMAATLLKHWNAPATVSSVTLAAVSKSGAEAENSVVTDLHREKASLSWTQLDKALPLPLPPADVDPVLALAVKYSDITPSLNQQTLRIHGLPTGNYDLLIDRRKIAAFSSDELSDGVNLATIETPMLEQSRLVAWDTEKKNDLESARFRIISKSAIAEESKTAAALAQAITIATTRQHADAQPRPHQFQIVPHQ